MIPVKKGPNCDNVSMFSNGQYLCLPYKPEESNQISPIKTQNTNACIIIINKLTDKWLWSDVFVFHSMYN